MMTGEAECGEGSALEQAKHAPVALKLDQSHYRIALPFQREVAASRVASYGISLTSRAFVGTSFFHCVAAGGWPGGPVAADRSAVLSSEPDAEAGILTHAGRRSMSRGREGHFQMGCLRDAGSSAGLSLPQLLHAQHRGCINCRDRRKFGAENLRKRLLERRAGSLEDACPTRSRPPDAQSGANKRSRWWDPSPSRQTAVHMGTEGGFIVRERRRVRRRRSDLAQGGKGGVRHASCR